MNIDLTPLIFTLFLGMLIYRLTTDLALTIILTLVGYPIIKFIYGLYRLTK